jgi:hypothetical protein
VVVGREDPALPVVWCTWIHCEQSSSNQSYVDNRQMEEALDLTSDGFRSFSLKKGSLNAGSESCLEIFLPKCS